MTDATTVAAAGDIDPIARDLKIPPCPEILAKFSAEVRRDDPDPRVLTRLITSDAGLSGAILAAVNSPLYGLSTKATDVAHALTLLGLRPATHLITGLLLRQAFPAAAGGLMRRYWDESNGVADAAVAVAATARGIGREEAYTYGLFRNCGMAVMIARFPDYGDIVEAHADAPGPELLLREEARYRYNHARVGYALARGWGLPEPLARSILLHHALDRIAARAHEAAGAQPRLAACGLLAEQVARLCAGGTLSAEWQAHEAFVLDTLEIEVDAVVALVQARTAAT
ncbi:MAG: HDOD domain-containing protein [Burkholderiales bacterium]|nr:HDOD domain-containing protein [Burkholderiales bacterium]